MIWSGSKKFFKVVLRQERILVLGFRTTWMKGFDPLQMLTTVIINWIKFFFFFLLIIIWMKLKKKVFIYLLVCLSVCLSI